MQIKLNYIGLIKNSTIVLDGLTVITGKNNSGKTTVGKMLYALVDAVSNLKAKARSDRNAYILKQLNAVKNLFVTTPIFGYNPDFSSLLHDYPALNTLLADSHEEQLNQVEEKYISKLEEELNQIDEELLNKIRNATVVWIDWNKEEMPSQQGERIRRDALAILERLSRDLEKDPKLINYVRESINQSLNIEFAGQVQSVHTPNMLSQVELFEQETPCFRLSIENNTVVNDGRPVFSNVPFKRVYMVDDPFVLDAPPVNTLPKGYAKKEFETFFNPSRVQVHSRKLRQAVIKSRRPVNIFEQTILNDSLKSIKEQIDHVLPGTFEFSSEGEYYVENGIKIRVSNLAAGSKMFSIIKCLLEGGRLDSATMLILDEPEAHLHPKWQNAFAEIIALLVKELKVNVLLTTHSPNFMLALDANMRKYDISEQTNFYQTDTLEDGFVQYHCVNDDLGQIYDDFLQYLSEMKVLRDRYLFGSGGVETV